jgi:hypothetical protein
MLEGCAFTCEWIKRELEECSNWQHFFDLQNIEQLSCGHNYLHFSQITYTSYELPVIWEYVFLLYGLDSLNLINH